MRHGRCTFCLTQARRARTDKKGHWLNFIARSLAASSLAVGLLVSASITNFGLAASAIAAEPVADSAALGLQLPDYIGVLEFMGERTPRGQHVARSYSYRAAGLSLDIDVFDYDASQLTAGIESAVLKKQFEHAKQETRASVTRRAKLLKEDVVQFGTDAQFPAREAVYRLTSQDFEHTNYLWLAGAQGRLLEMRFSIQEGFEEDGHVSRSEILAAVGEAVAHAPTPQQSKGLVAGVPRVNVSIVWDPKTPASENQLWMTYLLTRAAQIAKETSNQDVPLGDRQPSFDEEVRARTMAVNTFRNLNTQGPQLKSVYFDDLDRVEAAGFLREYAWRYLHAVTWTTPPTGLDLKAFDEWRATHLTDHVAVTYGRIALRLAEAK